MRYFHNDYNRMCHSAVLEKIYNASEIARPGYGMDPCCDRSRELVRKLCDREDLSVHFLVGGTQANLTVIDAALRPHQGVLCAVTGHINVHETGAVEATGHKVISMPSTDGKVTAQQVEETAMLHLSDGDKEHSVQPKMVYISNSTEVGTVYTLRELRELSATCKKYGYYLFMDGARLGYALTSRESDLTLRNIAELCDVFYIGMTKVGAMFGECVVISNPAIAEDFRYLIKQHGGMLAKGWLLGLQFEALFENDLYFKIARHANEMADILRDTLTELGYSFYVEGSTNQVFPILPNHVLAELSKEVTYSPMGRVDDSHQIVRFCTSWASTREDVEYLCELIRKVSN